MSPDEMRARLAADALNVQDVDALIDALEAAQEERRNLHLQYSHLVGRWNAVWRAVVWPTWKPFLQRKKLAALMRDVSRWKHVAAIKDE